MLEPENLLSCINILVLNYKKSYNNNNNILAIQKFSEMRQNYEILLKNLFQTIKSWYWF